MTASLRFQTGPTGMILCDLPGDTWSLMWTGPGSTTLYLAGSRPGQCIRVEPDRFQHDGTPAGARAAMRAFVAEGAEVTA